MRICLLCVYDKYYYHTFLGHFLPDTSPDGPELLLNAGHGDLLVLVRDLADGL